MKDRIYKLLYDKSTVDGIRLINEDEWPIEELEQLFKEEWEKAFDKACIVTIYGECKYWDMAAIGGGNKNPEDAMDKFFPQNVKDVIEKELDDAK